MRFFCVLPLVAGAWQLIAQHYGSRVVPAGNPLTPDKVALGRKLFFDSRLSANGRVSCSTCHDPRHAFTDSRAISIGVFGRRGDRRVPSLVGRGYGVSHFWDGRAATLEQQVLMPVENPKEMGATLKQVIMRLHSDPAFGALTVQSLRDALASYVRTIRSVDAPYDRYMSGAEGGLSDLAQRGLQLFRDKARCYICHSGDLFTDESFHNTGVAWRQGRLRDEGRAAVTGKAYDKGAFKTPTLREIVRTPPYMHDGSIATLEGVLDFYDRGGNPNPNLDENIVPLHLSGEEKRALLEFLRSLSGSVRDGL